MKTEIFKSYHDFLNREDKTINGVSEEFAKNNPGYQKDNATNKGCWDCESCVSCESCEYCEYCKYCKYCKSCEYCESCKSCVSCEYCKSCVSCESCESCVSCEYCERKFNSIAGELFTPPVVPDIHNAILEAVKGGEFLEMDSWHTCKTTHCRAGWAVHLAGNEGYDLEKKTSTAFAAMAIFNASSPIKVPPTKFYLSNKGSMEDIVKCAEEEIRLIREGK